MGFFVKQPLREDKEFKWQLYWRTCQPFCLLSQAPKRISIHVALLSAMWCFVTGFAIVFGAMLYSTHVYLHYWTLTSTTCNRLPEGRYDPIYILVINVTAACIRGCAASVGLLVTGKEKKGKGGEQRGQQTVKVPS